MKNKFKCDKCNAGCTVTANKSQHSEKKKPTDCIFGIFSLCTDKTIAKWKKVEKKVYDRGCVHTRSN